jgi:16S rRNA (guanine(527)-N(7))-methyltransferase RsmG
MSAAELPFIEGALAAHGIAPDAAARERIVAYVALLAHWNRRINLVGTHDAATLWRRHVLDCLMLETVPRAPALRRWLDAGSGAGLPGVLLAILHPELRVEAVESAARKATFLGEVARQLQLANFACTRADAWKLAGTPAFAPPDALVARALAPLDDLLALGAALLRPGGELWAMKGRRWADEAAQVAPPRRAAFEPQPGVHAYALEGGADGVILVYRRAGPGPTGA